MAEDINAQLERQLELIQQIADKKIELQSLDAAERNSIEQMANLLSNNEANIARMLQRRRDLLKTAKEQEGVDSNKAKQLELEIQKLKFILAQRQQLGATLDKRLGAIKKEAALIKKQEEGVRSVTDSLHKAVGAQVMYGLASEASAKRIEKANLKAQNKVLAFVPQADQQIQGFFKKFKKTAMSLIGTVGGPFLSFIAEKTGGVMKDMANSVMASLSTTTKAIDSNYRGMVMNLGHHTDQFQQIFLSNMTAMTSTLSEKGGFSQELKKLGRFLEDVYIDPKDSQEAMEALYNTASIFHEEMRDGRNVTAGYLSNMVAGFKKLGVATKSSSAMINIASKALGKTPIGSVEFMKSIKQVGSALGKNIGETFQEFIGMGSKLTMFGDRVTGVFGRIAAQAKAAGMETKSLVGIAMEFDTFEGAAKAAGQLNAVLGQTSIDAMALMQADPDKKIEMIRDAIAGSVGEFSELDRRTKQVIAGIITGGDVMKAQQMLSNKESFAAYADDLKKVSDKNGNIRAESNAALEDQMRQAGSIEQILNGAAANMSKVLSMVTFAQRKAAQGMYLAAEGAGAIANNLARIPGGVADMGSKIADMLNPQGFGGKGADGGATAAEMKKIMEETEAKILAMGFSHKQLQDMKNQLGSAQKQYFTKEAAAARKQAELTKKTADKEQARAQKRKGARTPTRVPEGKIQGFGGTNKSVQDLSKSMEKAVTTEMVKFNNGLRAITASASALRATLEGIGNSPALKNLASALSATKPLEVRTGPALPPPQPKGLEGQAKVSALTVAGISLKDILATPMDRRTRQLIDDMTSAQQQVFKNMAAQGITSYDEMKPEQKAMLTAAMPTGPISSVEKTITNLKTESLTIQQQPAEMSELVNKIGELITKLEINTTNETKASSAVVEAIKSMAIRLRIDGRDLKGPVEKIVERIS